MGRFVLITVIVFISLTIGYFVYFDAMGCGRSSYFPQDSSRNALIPTENYRSSTWGFKNQRGEWIIEPKYGYAYKFSEGLAAVILSGDWSDGKWGFIDEKGQIAFEQQFDEAAPFKDGMAPVLIKGQGWGFINKMGKFVIEPKFWTNSAFYKPEFSEGLLAVRLSEPSLDDETWGFIDKSGDVVSTVSISINVVRDFSEGLAQVRRSGNLWGYVNREGEVVIEPRFSSSGPFSGGLAPVQYKESRKWGYIDQKGNVVIPPRFLSAGVFREGRAVVQLTGDPEKDYLNGWHATINQKGRKLCVWLETYD